MGDLVAPYNFARQRIGSGGEADEAQVDLVSLVVGAAYYYCEDVQSLAWQPPTKNCWG